jgi:HSP20 family protein
MVHNLNNTTRNKNFKQLKNKKMTYVTTNKTVNPFDGLVKELFNDFGNFGRSVREDVLHFPPVNITETTKAYELELSVAGYNKDEIEIKLDNNILTVSSTHKTETTTENAETKAIRKEFTKKSFKRSFTLTEKVNTEGIEASYTAGILKITLSKKENEIAAVKQISIQ